MGRYGEILGSEGYVKDERCGVDPVLRTGELLEVLSGDDLREVQELIRLKENLVGVLKKMGEVAKEGDSVQQNRLIVEGYIRKILATLTGKFFEGGVRQDGDLVEILSGVKKRTEDIGFSSSPIGGVIELLGKTT